MTPPRSWRILAGGLVLLLLSLAPQRALATDAGLASAACGGATPAASGAGVVSIKMDDATQWQPLGGTALIHVRGDQTLLAAMTFSICVRRDKAWYQVPFLVRQGATDPGGIELAVPVLKDAAKAAGSAGRTAFGLVPLASLRVTGTNAEGQVRTDNVLTLGVPDRGLAAVVVFVLVVTAFAVLRRVAVGPYEATRLEGRLRAFLRPRWLLQTIRAVDGTASLSRFQIMLWTVVVLAATIYVMCLSGQLVNLSAGTLGLLGIAGAAGLLAALKEGGSPPTGTAAQAPDAVPPPAVRATPAWSDMLHADGSSDVDVTRVQMLLFTLLCAGFVALQVSTTYVIPDIPPGYLILVGLANGVYITGKYR